MSEKRLFCVIVLDNIFVKIIKQLELKKWFIGSEDEALILECNLIKKYRPRFNVLLKDDKTYPYIRIDVKSDYPGIFMTRKLQKDGAKYFGPYASSRKC